MTTIVYRDGVLAGDSLITGSDIRCGLTRKVWKHKDRLFGICGAYDDMPKAEAWFKAIDKKITKPCPLNTDNSEAILVLSPKKVLYVTASLPYAIMKPVPGGNFYAIGSGSHIAIGALSMGAAAEEAVKAAIKYDVYSGGPVKSVRLK